MGLTRYWQGRTLDRRDWTVNVARSPDFAEPRVYEEDRSGFLDQFVSIRRWVESADDPTFGAWAYDDDFAYLCVGAGREVLGVLLFDRATLDSSYEVGVPDELLTPGAAGVAEWAQAYAPMRTGAGVMKAFADEGGAGDGVMQLMRVLKIDLPYEYSSTPPKALASSRSGVT